MAAVHPLVEEAREIFGEIIARAGSELLTGAEIAWVHRHVSDAVEVLDDIEAYALLAPEDEQAQAAIRGLLGDLRKLRESLRDQEA
jgi:hypothetical protein